MAVTSGSLNMLQYAIQSNDPLVTAITNSLIDNGAVMADIPFTNKQSLKVNGVRWEGNLPTVNWSQLNAEGVSSVGTPTPYQEQAYILRDYIDVDKYFVQDVNRIQDPREVQVDAHMKAITYDFNYKFIWNDHVAGDANAPVGLAYRINNGTTFGVRSANKIDGGGLDLTQATLITTPGNANKLIEFIDQLLWSVDSPDGENVILYCNEVFKRRLNFAMRGLGTSGGLQITTDQYDRKVESFRSAQIRDIGYKADQSTRIITNTELATGLSATGSTFTSVYAVNYGMSHFFGFQFDTLQARDLGLLNNGTQYRTLVDWAGGFINASNRSIARLYDLKMS
jgi:hypothetical protein